MATTAVKAQIDSLVALAVSRAAEAGIPEYEARGSLVVALGPEAWVRAIQEMPEEGRLCARRSLAAYFAVGDVYQCPGSERIALLSADEAEIESLLADGFRRGAMPEVSIGQLSRSLSDIIRRVRENGEGVTVTRHGEPVARIVPHEQAGYIVARVAGPEEAGVLKIEAKS